MQTRTLVTLFVFLCLCGCSASLTTDIYNRLAFNEIPGLAHDGYVVAIEKIAREKISDTPVCSTTDNSCFDATRYQQLAPAIKHSATRNSNFRRTTNDPKLMVVTHLFSYDQGKSSAVFNAYAGLPDRKAGPATFSVEAGYEAVSRMAAEIRDRISRAAQTSNPYTHIFLMSMGWNNDQQESIRRYNVIVDNLVQAKGSRAFRPMVIGITWPSSWLSGAESTLMQNIGHIGSLFNKANDADEIGYTLLSELLYRHLLPIKAELPTAIPVVLIGHSYGGRLLSRTLFSDVHIRNLPAATPPVDLFLGLQPAFSANRFIDGEGLEGSPYDDFASRQTRIILTTSRYDTANPLAFWSRHIGGKWGWDQANDNNQSGNNKVFFTTSWHNGFAPPLPANYQSVVMVNADSIVCDHNDILGDDMAQLIWAGLDDIAKRPPLPATAATQSAKCEKAPYLP